MKNGLGLFYFPDVEDYSFEVGGEKAGSQMKRASLSHEYYDVFQLGCRNFLRTGYTARNEQCEDE